MPKLNFLITAGPTREYIDPVRYISNDSSGKMGFALARAAQRLGHKVTLVAGPVALKTPKGVVRVDVVSANDMYREVIERRRSADVIIMAAAVADFGVKKFSKQKIKKKGAAANFLSLKLKKNPDILLAISAKKRKDQTVVGFALETENVKRNARTKLKAKGCDYIVANSAKVIGRNNSSVIIISRSGKTLKLSNISKNKLALCLLNLFPNAINKRF